MTSSGDDVHPQRAQRAHHEQRDRAERLREFNRYYTQRVGILSDRYLGQNRPLSEARVLFEIGQGVDLRDLRVRLGLDSGFLSRLIRSLERQGLVAVGPSPDDGRVRVATLTDDGRRELDDLNERATGLANRLLSGLPAAQQEQLVSATDRARHLLRLSAIEVGAVDPSSEAARRCLSAFADELRQRFPEGFDDADLVSARELSGDAGALLVATEDGEARGCVAVRVIEPDVGEIRHMWVHPGARGIGLGRRLLHEIEVHAAGMDLRVLRLATHGVLDEAIALYRSAGYAAIDQYGPTPHAQHWFEKHLGRRPETRNASASPDLHERSVGLAPQ
ncbi:bifunctional helix-turn-helix transcriptional regulator/GNAT family N-acetyltransferase [Phytoactinopolyspora halotolerans]|uniref:MarR family transcriptional regulator n=1 Tax=Phytoactinopolyspora halotolerans TaxID=1981512 RepID=A0A6L9SF55_9ACTN|nr:helix-turn-helix domain-containing GNAT family N-acetyltransferase [Phytoactinopolyspora halotolerans]NEE03141.1 MarR family transcriptional regulator [Phytoactinopolyspora halotolerans]